MSDRTALSSGFLLSLSLGGVSFALQDEIVDVPANWYSGDPHEHIQQCAGMQGSGIDPYPIDKTPQQIYDAAVRKGINVANVMVWAPPVTTEQEFFAEYSPLVVGDEHPVSISDPDHIVQFSFESSGFEMSQLGHVNFHGLDSAIFDTGLDYAAPMIDAFKAQNPSVIAGYAHQVWPTGFTSAGGFVGEDYKCTAPVGMDYPPPALLWFGAPTLAPMDIAFGRIDYLESVDLELTLAPNYNWTGSYYKLLSAGQRVSAAAGTDVNCIDTVSGDDPRTYVRVPGGALTYDNWNAGLAAGRVSLAMGPSEFLNMRVNDEPIGSQVGVNGPSVVSVEVDLHAAPAVTIDDTIEILVNGVVVAVKPVSGLSGDVFSTEVLVSMDESGWIAARTGSLRTHTGATYVVVDGWPIVDCESAEYWSVYTEYLLYTLELAVQAGVEEEYVGDSLVEIFNYIVDGHELYTAIRDYAHPLPAGAERLRRSTGACQGPIGTLVDRSPIAGDSVNIQAFNGPTDKFGVLAFSPGFVPSGYFVNGAQLFLDISQGVEVIPAVTNKAGFADVEVLLPDLPGVTSYCQFLWFFDGDCRSSTPGVWWSASETLRLTLQ